MAVMGTLVTLEPNPLGDLRLALMVHLRFYGGQVRGIPRYPVRAYCGLSAAVFLGEVGDRSDCEPCLLSARKRSVAYSVIAIGSFSA